MEGGVWTVSPRTPSACHFVAIGRLHRGRAVFAGGGVEHLCNLETLHLSIDAGYPISDFT